MIAKEPLLLIDATFQHQYFVFFLKSVSIYFRNLRIIIVIAQFTLKDYSELVKRGRGRERGRKKERGGGERERQAERERK